MPRLFWLSIIAASFALPSALQAAAAPITKAEARSLSERKLKAIVMAQLSDLIREPVHSDNPAPKSVLGDVTYITRPRATAMPGLCALDMLTVHFRPLDEKPRDQDTPVMADGFDANHYFLVRKPVDKSYNEAAIFDRTPNDAACASSDFFRDAWFSATNEEDASDGAMLARRAIADGGSRSRLECANAGIDLRENCGSVLAALDPAAISGIDRCEPDPADRDTSYCYKVYFSDVMLLIRARRSASGPNATAELSIASVAFHQLIVIADQRVD